MRGERASGENCIGPMPVDACLDLELLASALAGRPVGVAATGPGEPAWTDGTTVHLDVTDDRERQLESLAVQTSLLAAGSLDVDIARRLVRRPGLTRRYLAVEGRRALACNAELLPPALRAFVDDMVGADTPSTSSAESLARAADRTPTPDPPRSFGVIRVQTLLKRAEQSGAVADLHVGRPDRERAGDELDEATGDEGADPFSSPVGAGGALGKLLGRLTNRVKRLGAGTPSGGDAVMQQGHRSGVPSRTVVSVASRQSDQDGDDIGSVGALRYPEWDSGRRAYRAEWCTVIENEPRYADGSTAGLPPTLPLRRALTRLAVGLQRCGRQRQGDDIDIDAAVEARVQALAGAASQDEVYLDFLRRKRELSVLLLLDVSGSAKEAGHGGHTVHEHQRAAAGALAATLYELGDRVALYGFCSQGRSAVHLSAVKRFDEPMGGAVLGKLDALVPGGYSRLGAAIRHGTSVLTQSAGTNRQLLVVLTDGLAYDHGYEREYGAADARRALAESRRAGVGCLCLTVGAGTDVGELRQVFGSTAHAAVPGVAQLPAVIGPLFRSALQSADLRGRKFTGASNFRAETPGSLLNLISVPR